MIEDEWVKHISECLKESDFLRETSTEVRTGLSLPYGFEITSHRNDDSPLSKITSFETDLAIIEVDGVGNWKPRVIIEAKIRNITTHDAITYSHKAASHKAVHPYLRYGIMLGNRQHHPLPGRLYRHGSHFDLMYSFAYEEVSPHEIEQFRALLANEIEASRTMEKLIYENRSSARAKYTIFHRKLEVR